MHVFVTEPRNLYFGLGGTKGKVLARKVLLLNDPVSRVVVCKMLGPRLRKGMVGESGFAEINGFSGNINCAVFGHAGL